MTSPLRVVHVDDSAHDRALVRHSLETAEQPFEIIEAASRSDFEAQLDRGGFDLVLTDFNIAGYEGVEVISAVHARYPDVPVVVVTGTGSETVAVESLRRGAADYVIKTPQHIRRLPTTLAQVRARHLTRLESERLRQDLDRFFRLSLDMLCIAGTDGYFKRVNPAFTQVLGFSEVELLATPFLELMDPRDVAATQAEIQGLIEGRPIVGFRSRSRHRDGSLRVLSWVASHADGLMYAVARDVTTEQEALSRLQAAERRHRELIENASYGIYVSDAATGRLSQANPALARMLGYASVEELLEVPMTAHYRDLDERERVLEQFAAGEVRGVEVDWVRCDGQSRTVRLSGRPILDAEDQVVQFEVIVEDVEERFRLEQQLRQAQKMEAVGRLAGGVAHDFNNLLTAILGYAELAADRAGPEDEIQGDLEEVRRAAAHAARLTAQLLTFSRHQPSSPRVIRLDESIEETRRMIQRLLVEEIVLGFRLEAPGARIVADPTELAQVIMNLVVNARDAMPEGGRIEITTEIVDLAEGDGQLHLEAQPGPHALLTVQDSGEGIDATALGQIFEPFYTTKAKGHGTGLGLSTVYGVVRGARGHIEVDSARGQGTTFRVYWPLASQPGVPEGVAANAQVPTGTETVLLVDDEQLVLELGFQQLTGLGYTVLTAGSSADALQISQSTTDEIQLLVTDLGLPEVGGVDLARRLREARPGLAVLFLTGYLDRDPADIDVPSRMLLKPFDRASLGRAVRDCLHAHRPSRPQGETD